MKVDEQLKQSIDELQRTWHEQIPITRYMQLEICHRHDDVFAISAPLEPNINVHQTMFAGSIYTVATLCGWGAVHLSMAKQKAVGSIVLADANIRYRKPVKGMPIAETMWQKLEVNWELLKSGNKVKINVAVNVIENNDIAAVFTGVYVVLPK